MTVERPAGVDRAIWLLAASQTITWAGIYYIFPAMLIRWEAEAAWTKTELTAAFTIAVAASALFSPLTGRLIDKGFGPQVIAGSTLVGGLLIGLLSQVHEMHWFVLIWAVIGMCMAGALYEPCFALVTRCEGARARRSITLITLVAGFAGTVSFPSAFALSEAFGWRPALVIVAVAVCAISTPLAWVGSRRLELGSESPTEIHKDASGSSFGFLSRAEFWLLAIAFSMIAVCHGMLINHLLPLLDERGIHRETGVLAASMIGPMQVAGRLAMMSVERHVSNSAIMSWCFIGVLAATLCLIASSLIPVLLVAFVILQGSGYGVTSIMKPVITRDILGERNFGTISGALAVPYLAGFAFAALLGSLIWEVGGYDLMLKAASGFAALGLAGYIAADRLNARHTRMR